MRKLLATAALGAAIAATALPVTSASAYCDPLIEALTGRCGNTCTVTAGAYHRADQAVKDRLPDVPFECPM